MLIFTGYRNQQAGRTVENIRFAGMIQVDETASRQFSYLNIFSHFPAVPY
jgi:hypothetical protein